MTTNDRPVRAVFFDAGGTLLRPIPSIEGIYCQVCRGLGAELPEREMHPVLMRLWEDVQSGRGDENGHLPDSDERDRAFWRDHSRRVHASFDALRGVDFDVWFDRLHASFAASRSWEPFIEVEETLTLLERRGIVLGIVSNWGSSLLRICDDLELTHRFAFVLASARVGHRKPSREIFHHALELANVPPEEAIHVGDMPLDDKVGADRAGLRGVLLDRLDTHEGHEDRIRSLLDIISLVDARSQG
jgi:putative hydrolase of the HAD superfamily